MAEKVAISYIYLVVSLIKSKYSRDFNLTAYSHIKDHVFLFLQNLVPLLTFLLSLTLALHNIIRII